MKDDDPKKRQKKAEKRARKMDRKLAAANAKAAEAHAKAAEAHAADTSAAAMTPIREGAAAGSMRARRASRPRASSPATRAPARASRSGVTARPDASEMAEGPLPADRPSLLALHCELRRRRDALPLMSEERAQTVIELAGVEVEVARIERAMDPPLV